MMHVEAVDREGLRRRVKDPFYQNTTSILAMENDQVLGRIEYHFYGKNWKNKKRQKDEKQWQNYISATARWAVRNLLIF